MARRNPDNLNGNETNLFNFPGKVILWCSYIGAKKGEVFASARRARSPIVTNVYSLLFWAGLAFFIWAFITSDPVVIPNA